MNLILAIVMWMVWSIVLGILVRDLRYALGPGAYFFAPGIIVGKFLMYRENAGTSEK